MSYMVMMIRSMWLVVFLAVVCGSAGCPSLGTVYGDRGNVEVEADLAYIEDGSPQHRCDLYSPADAKSDAPVVVFFHGGYWSGQDKQYWEFASGLYGNVGVALAREGARVANCNYRLFPDVLLDGMLNDVDAAVTSMRGRFPRAPIVLMGHSAGAHVASAAPLLPNGPRTDVDAQILVSGIFDIESGVENDSQENRDKILLPLFGETPAEQRLASTVDLFATSAIPTLLVAGTDDLPGIVLDFNRLSSELADRENFSFLEIDGADHAGTVLQIASDDDEVTPAVTAHLKAHGLLD